MLLLVETTSTNQRSTMDFKDLVFVCS